MSLAKRTRESFMKEKFIHKKRFVIPIIIAVALIAVFAIAYSFLAPKSLVGDWELIVNPEITKSTPDEAENSDRAYYTFGESDKNGNGVYKTYYDGGVEEGRYKISEKDGKKFIDLGTEELEYRISGSGLFGGVSLTIIYPEYTDEQTGEKSPAQEYVFAQAKAPEYKNESYDSFETDNALVAEWTTNERFVSYGDYKLPYTETVRFNENGIMTIHYESTDLALNRYMYYAYTAENGSLTFSLVTDKETEYTVLYSFDKDGNLSFIEEKAPTSIFADAVFSDVTYYKSDKTQKADDK